MSKKKFKVRFEDGFLWSTTDTRETEKRFNYMVEKQMILNKLKKSIIMAFLMQFIILGMAIFSFSIKSNTWGMFYLLSVIASFILNMFNLRKYKRIKNEKKTKCDRY
jgi:hypothetical protein